MALYRKKGLAMKDESVYNTDPTIAEATDSIQHANLEVVGLDGDFINRDLDRDVLGAQGDILVSSRVLVNFEVEAAGSGAATTPPPYAECLLGCGMAETVGASDVSYNPVSAAFDSKWLEANFDGLQHTCGGARGSMSFSWETRQIPRLAFSYTGLYAVPTDVAIPSYTLSAFQIPEAFNNANTPTATLFGQSIALEQFSLDMQNQVEHRDIIGNEEILIVDREVRGTISFERPLIATYDWWSAIANRTQGVLQIIHGDTTGNIVQIDAPKVEVSAPRYRDSQGTIMMDLDLVFVPSAGDDEFTFLTK
jgi:hypothetical protein